jgi:hypothetical protein
MSFDIKIPPPPLRDIRVDLKDRLRAAIEKSALLDAQLQDARSEVRALEQLLEVEERRHQLSQQARPRQPVEPLAEFIEGALQQQAMTKEELRDYAERAGYAVDGRSIHATLVNLMRTNRVIETEEGYAVPESEEEEQDH